MKRLFIIFTIGALGFIMSQSCNDIEPKTDLIQLDVKHISKCGDTLVINIDTTCIKNKE
jgi:hypothetical protein